MYKSTVSGIARMFTNSRFVCNFASQHDCRSSSLYSPEKFASLSSRQLQCDRVTLHKHLFIAYLLNAIIWICHYSILQDTQTTQTNSVSQVFLTVHSERNERKSEEILNGELSIVFTVSEATNRHMGRGLGVLREYLKRENLNI